VNLDLCDGDEGRAWLADLERGVPWRDALEAQLLRLELVRAERLMQVLKEGRGTWLALALERATRRVWFVGNALSGTLLVLARLGARVTAFDPSEERGALACARDRHHARGALVFEPWTRTTFDTAREAPDLCVVEGPVPSELGGDEALFARLAALRVPRVFAVVDNRFSYKRSTGVRADLRVQSPLAFVRRALKGPERSLGGTRRALARFGAAQALALYPHRWDFSHVVDVDDPHGPQLFIGPGERTNRAKMLALRAGLFTWLAPSFAVGGPRVAHPLLGSWIAAVRERGGVEPGRVEHVVATRGNNALLLTSGGLAIHVPLGPDQERQMRHHHALLGHLSAHLPHLAVPQPIWSGDVDGVFVQVETRVGAINGAQLVHEVQRERVMLPQCAELLARAVVSPPAVPSAAELEELVLERARAAAARAGRPETARALLELGERCAAALARLAFPRVFGHNDLRAKHVAVDERGNALALLDLGCGRTRDLPYVDLLNLVLHDHKDHALLVRGHAALGAAWHAARERRLPPALEAVLDRYEQLLALPREYTDAVRAAYPVFVAAAAEQNWDYSRPRWVHRQLGL
jgi:hypothetical protein